MNVATFSRQNFLFQLNLEKGFPILELRHALQKRHRLHNEEAPGQSNHHSQFHQLDTLPVPCTSSSGFQKLVQWLWEGLAYPKHTWPKLKNLNNKLVWYWYDGPKGNILNRKKRTTDMMCQVFAEKKRTQYFRAYNFSKEMGEPHLQYMRQAKNAGSSFLPIRWSLQKYICKKVFLRNYISPEDPHVPFLTHKDSTALCWVQVQIWGPTRPSSGQIFNSTKHKIVSDKTFWPFDSWTEFFCNCHKPHQSLCEMPRPVSGSGAGLINLQPLGLLK